MYGLATWDLGTKSEEFHMIMAPFCFYLKGTFFIIYRRIVYEYWVVPGYAQLHTDLYKL